MVSIGLPVFNGEDYLEEAIDSIIAQTYGRFQLIISDNSSTDRTPEMCEAYTAKDERVRYYRSAENRGLAWNYNRVFELSKGKYFKWAAHDDVCAPEYIERCLEVLERMPDVIVCYTKTIIINEYGEQVQHYRDDLNVSSESPCERFQNLLSNIGLSNPVFGLIRMSALRENPFGPYIASDLPLLAELALIGKYFEVPEWLFFRRDHPKKSNYAYPTDEATAILYDPANKGKIVLRTWKLSVEYLASIRRIRMSLRERVLKCIVTADL